VIFGQAVALALLDELASGDGFLDRGLDVLGRMATVADEDLLDRVDLDRVWSAGPDSLVVDDADDAIDERTFRRRVHTSRSYRSELAAATTD
jgi:hypothetical protein